MGQQLRIGVVYRLLIEDDEGRTTVVPLIRDELSIGRREGNTIRLTERNVSRRHARVVREHNLFYVEDLGSYNGLRVNGERISGRRPVREGDLIQIGDYHLRILRDPDRAPSTPSETTAPVSPQPPVRAQVRTEPLGHFAAAGERAPAIAAAPVITVPLGAARRPSAPARPVAEELEAPRLVVLTPGLGVAEIPVTAAGVVLGREGTIPLPDRSLEREHARVVLEGQRATIYDLGGGVRVNGEAVAVGELREGDLIELGRAKFRFAATGPAVAGPGPAAGLPAEPIVAGPERSTSRAAQDFVVPLAMPVTEEAAENQIAPDEPPAPAPLPVRRSRRRIAYAALGVGAAALTAVALYLGVGRSPSESGEARGKPPLPAWPAAAPPVPAIPPAFQEPPAVAREVDRLPAAPPADLRGARPSPARRLHEMRPPGATGPARPADRRPDQGPGRWGRGGTRRLAARSPAVGSVEERSLPPPTARQRPESSSPLPAAAKEPVASRKREARAQARELFRRGTKELLSSPVRAVEIFRRALDLDPSLAEAHKNLGIAYSALENSEAAIRHYQHYLRLRPNAPDAEEVRQQLAEIRRSVGP
jgi:pSer/pThr/pTyr-binding forkhead associated (FHA) protein